MPSNINYASINENFPVPGQDNDTQVFRDNFDTIKNSLSTAKTEVGELLDNAARTDLDNDFNGNRIANATVRDIKELKYTPAGIITAGEGQSSITVEINAQNGMYQIYRFGSNADITFEGFSQTNLSRITVEVYGDGDALNPRTINFLSTGGSLLKKSSNFPGTLTVSSSINPIIIEVWRHDAGKIFLNYLGQFS
jgi:hypothetical protein